MICYQTLFYWLYLALILLIFLHSRGNYLSFIPHNGGGISSPLLSSLTTGTNVTYTSWCGYKIKNWLRCRAECIRKCIGTLYLDFGTGGLYLFIRSVSDTRTWSISRKKQARNKCYIRYIGAMLANTHLELTHAASQLTVPTCYSHSNLASFRGLPLFLFYGLRPGNEANSNLIILLNTVWNVTDIRERTNIVCPWCLLWMSIPGILTLPVPSLSHRPTPPGRLSLLDQCSETHSRPLWKDDVLHASNQC